MTVGVKRETVGSGMTTAERVTYDLLTPEGVAAYEQDRQAGVFAFSQTIESARRWADEAFRRMRLPPGIYVCTGGRWLPSPDGSGSKYFRVPKAMGVSEDSALGFAARIVQTCIFLESNLKKGEADRAASNAYHLGTLVAQCRMKFAWEKSALHGQKMKAEGKSNLQKYNAKKLPKNQRKWESWQAAADPVWKRHPTFSSSRVAEKIKEKHGFRESADRIARRIKKSGTLA
jgi:hypothetical protein